MKLSLHTGKQFILYGKFSLACGYVHLSYTEICHPGITHASEVNE
jgi:hypothetical protein